MLGELVSVAAEAGDRARQRAEERERRALERISQAQERSERRTIERERESRDRQEMREARRLEEAERLKALRPEPTADAGSTTAAPKRRPSGAIRRTGEAKIIRDTRNYTTVVDADRIRELASRGTPASSLANVFGISLEEVEAVLGGSDIPCGGESPHSVDK